MTEKEEKILAEFEIRMRQLMYLCDSLKEENALLKQELSLKDGELKVLGSTVEELKLKYDNLKFAKALSSSDRSEMLIAKGRLSKLVREVDKCIALLKS